MAEALIERLGRLADTAYALGNVDEANAIRDLIVALEEVNGRPEELDINELAAAGPARAATTYHRENTQNTPRQEAEDLPDEDF